MNVKMKVAEVIDAHKYLSGLNLKHFETTVTTPLLISFISLAKIVKDFEASEKDLQDKTFKDYQETLEKLRNAQDKRAVAKTDDEFKDAHKEFLEVRNSSEGKAYFAAEKKFLEAKEALLEAEVEVKIEKFSRTKFIAALIKGEDSFTLDNLSKIELLWKDN